MNNYLFTCQEHNLFGSTMREYEHAPYTPIAVLRGDLSPEECQVQRFMIKEIGALPVVWNQNYIQGKMSLEDLDLDKNSDTYGQTVFDPRLVNMERKINKVLPKFPFPHRRDTKPLVGEGPRENYEVKK